MNHRLRRPFEAGDGACALWPLPIRPDARAQTGLRSRQPLLGLPGFRRFSFLRRLGRRLDPARHNARAHDNRLGLLARQIKPVKEARMLLGLALAALSPTNKIVGGATGKVLDRLDLVLAELDQHGRRDAVDRLQFIGDAQSLALFVVLGFDLRQMALRAGLNFRRGVGVESFDRREFLRLHIGQLLDGSEAFGGEQLGDDFIDVERVHEDIGAFDEFLLPAFGLFRFGQNIDVPTRQLRGETYVLPAPPDGQRKLIVGDDDFDARRILVEHDFHHLGRLQRVDDEGRRVRRPRNDIDLLALLFVDHRLDARTAHADAGSDRINRGIVGDDRDLGARAGIARDGLHLDDAVVNLRHFLREELGGELRMGARKENLRAPLFAPDVIDIGADAIAGTEHFARDQFIAPDHGFASACAAEIDDNVAIFDALDDAVDDLADAVLIDVVLFVALGLADLLDQDLL